MGTVIERIASYLPDSLLTNAMLHEENPDWDMVSVADKAGVEVRHIARADETALDLSMRACERLFASSPESKSTVDAILFCTQTPDFLMPGNAHVLHAQLGLGDRVLAFDYNLACSGYIYGLALAHSILQSSLASKVLLVTADTYSKHINVKDRSARVLFGDGAAATLLSRGGERNQLQSFSLCTHGREYQKFYIPAGGARCPRSGETAVENTDRNGNRRTGEQIHMDGMGVWSFINSAVPAHIRTFLEEHSLRLDDIDHFVFHQASKMTLDSLIRVLGIPPEKAYRMMSETGNLVSASIPLVLEQLFAENRFTPGDRVLLCGFGVGLSYGSALLLA